MVTITETPHSRWTLGNFRDSHQRRPNIWGGVAQLVTIGRLRTYPGLMACKGQGSNPLTYTNKSPVKNDIYILECLPLGEFTSITAPMDQVRSVRRQLN